MTTAQIDLTLLFRGDTAECEDCAQRLVQHVALVPGVEQIHLTPGDEANTRKLCVHYQPGVASLARIRASAEREGARLTGRYGHLVWEVTGLSSVRRADTVAATVGKLEGVVEVGASAAGLVRIGFDRQLTNETSLRAALARLRVRPAGEVARLEQHDSEHDSEHDGEHDGEHGEHGEHGEAGHDHAHGGAGIELVVAVLAALCLSAGYLLATFTTLPAWVSLTLYGATYVFGGFFTLREAFESVRAGRFQIDSLMLVAAAGAAALGEYAEGGLLLVLFSLGHSLEGYAMGRAKRAIEALAELAPKHATVKRAGGLVEVRVEELVPGDVVVVKPDERLPVDGLVLTGESAVNQAPITGESVPVDKRPLPTPRPPDASVDEAHKVFAGSINGSGALEVEVTRVASESTLARVVKMVNEAETQRSPTQAFTDRFERIFVPVVLALVVVLLFGWVVIDEPFKASFYRAMAVLVAASPCALAIATPSAVLSAVARAGRSGVLVKGGAPLESLGRVTAIAFDKTGTLTEGHPEVSDVVLAEGCEEAELLAVAGSVELLSDHPLAGAVVRAARARDLELLQARELQSITGRGVSARLSNTLVHIGSVALFDEIEGPPVPGELVDAATGLAKSGRTTMLVRQGDRYLGILGLMDKPKESCAAVLRELAGLGVTRMVMLSGDRQEVAAAVAAQIGLSEAHGDLMPDDKVAAIQRIRLESGSVAMVGDGVNDAPAMATATVAIAMGAASSDVALETADIALMADDLTRLPFAVALSRRASQIIRQNLWVSLGMVAILLPATLFGLGIGPAVALHEGSTLLVVANALRLLAYREN